MEGILEMSLQTKIPKHRKKDSFLKGQPINKRFEKDNLLQLKIVLENSLKRCQCKFVEVVQEIHRYIKVFMIKEIQGRNEMKMKHIKSNPEFVHC